VAATELGKQALDTPGKPPLAFSVAYDPAKITDRSDCAVQVRVEKDGKLLFITDTRFSVLTRGRPDSGIVVRVIPVK
jgi:putative lipoprotein